MTTLNNVDAGLTPEPDPDPWADHDELTEDTTPSELSWGQTADAYFDVAHAAGAALRKLRRQRAAVPVEQAPPEKGCPPRIGHCAQCGHYVSGWHRPCGDNVAIDVHETSEMAAYHQRLWLATRTAVTRVKRQDVPGEWREPPGYPNYLLHSTTRELWRRAYAITLPNGTVRRYPAKSQKPTNGSYSLSVNGVKSSRGIHALWSETFPEYGKKKKKTGVWASEVEPHRAESSYYRGLEEWLAEGGAHIVTRP